MSKSEAKGSGLNINTKYLRDNAEGFSLAPKGQEKETEFDKCNYYTDRKADTKAEYVVQTYSVGSLEDTLAKMVLPKGGDITVLRGPGVSVHYIIDQDGTTYQLVPDSKRPWAAGVGDLRVGSKLNPAIPGDIMKNDMNSFSISIMSINDGKTALTAPQVKANLQLTSHLVKTHHIDPQHVIALADWAPGRHIAPGPYFPWQDFAGNGLGLWSNVERKKDPEIIVSYKQKPLAEEVDHIQQAFEELSKKYSAGSSGEVVRKFAESIQPLKGSLEKAVVADVSSVDHALSRGLGMVGVPNAKDPAGHLDSATLSSMLCFNLHHLGQQIINSPLVDVYNGGLWVDSSNPEARGLLGQWTTNSHAVLDDILGS